MHGRGGVAQGAHLAGQVVHRVEHEGGVWVLARSDVAEGVAGEELEFGVAGSATVHVDKELAAVEGIVDAVEELGALVSAVHAVEVGQVGKGLVHDHDDARLDLLELLDGLLACVTGANALLVGSGELVGRPLGRLGRVVVGLVDGQVLPDRDEGGQEALLLVVADGVPVHDLHLEDLHVVGAKHQGCAKQCRGHAHEAVLAQVATLLVVRLDRPARMQQREHADAGHDEDHARDRLGVERVGVLLGHGGRGAQDEEVVGQDRGVLELAHEVLRDADEGKEGERHEGRLAVTTSDEVEEERGKQDECQLEPPERGTKEPDGPAPRPLDGKEGDHAEQKDEAPLRTVAQSRLERGQTRMDALSPKGQLREGNEGGGDAKRCQGSEGASIDEADEPPHGKPDENEAEEGVPDEGRARDGCVQRLLRKDITAGETYVCDKSGEKNESR